MRNIAKRILKMANFLKEGRTRPYTVIVEGNIGSGKTTFLNYFNRNKDVCVLAEPVEMWRDCDGYNLLGAMYEDPKRWSFTFQSYVQLTMLQQHTKETDLPIKLMERSIYSARYCFVEQLKRDKVLSGPSESVINAWFNWVTSNKNLDVDLVVYLRTTPEVVYERMMKRNRAEEKSVPLEYLKSLHKIHEDWLYYKTLHHCPAPVIILNANLDRSNIANEYEKCESHIFNKEVVTARA
ncbi:unnamed protein product [Brassicogethes aeneus]|uniref:Deoxynucleoside kinase domain-containing protein n=1 Tax=Brassicogethes aeneus TaxID=1431903 RepID=A0A9P0BDK9_BRAAE|nr:unnamed protein product [Brassicogethes aeneus]